MTTSNIINKNKIDWNKLRVAVYTRVSTNDQYVNWVWIDAQYDKIMSVIKFNSDKYTFDKKKHYYVDWAESWVNKNRPELDRMIRDIDNWEIDIILVYKIDRLFRKLILLLDFVEKISDKWVFLKSCNENIDTSESMWLVLLQFMGIIWDIERENIRIRTIDWKKLKAKIGYYVWWWKTPFWYDLKVTPWWKKLIINNKEAKIVNRIFDLYVNKNHTLWEIAKILTSEKIPTRDDRVLEKVKKENKNIDDYLKVNKDKDIDVNITHKLWSKKKLEWHWYPSNISKILKREIYTWKYHYWMTTKEKNSDGKYVIVKKPRSEWVPFDCESILTDLSLYSEAQKLLAKNVNKKRKSPYIFSWMITCWKCGMSYNWYKASKWTFQYRCRGWMSSSKMNPRCKNSEISEEILFKYCWWELERNLSNPDNFKAISFNKEKNKKNISDLNRRITEIEELLISKKKILNNALEKELEADNKDTKISYQNIIIKIKGEISQLEVESQECKIEIKIIKSNEKKNIDVENFNKDHQKAIENLDYDKKVKLLKKYIDNIKKNVWKIHIKFNILDNMDWRDFREWENGDKKNLKSELDFFNLNTLNLWFKDIILPRKKRK